jgi:hypothetical protein
MNPDLLIFTLVLFLFNVANSSVLPLVMQSLALQDPRAGILLSGVCIVIAQSFMTYFAKACGDYSPIPKNSHDDRTWVTDGPIVDGNENEERGAHILKASLLLIQVVDAVGAGILGTMRILVDSTNLP